MGRAPAGEEEDDDDVVVWPYIVIGSPSRLMIPQSCRSGLGGLPNHQSVLEGVSSWIAMKENRYPTSHLLCSHQRRIVMTSTVVPIS